MCKVRSRQYACLIISLLGFALTGIAIAQVNIVGTNSDLALTINGTNYFGMAVSPGPAVGALAYNGSDALDELRSGGIQFYRMPVVPTWKSSNALNLTTVATNQAALDWCAQHGMLMLFNLNDLSYFSASDTNTPTLLTNLLGLFSAHPGMGMYKNLDEAWWGTQSGGQGTVANMTRGYNLIHQLDPLHPVEQTHAPRGTVTDLQPYNSAADILMVDDYPVVTNGTVANNPPITNTNVSQFGDWAHELSQVANRQRTFWMVEQIAFSGTTPPSHGLIFPTFQQERYMAFQAIVNGARGLMFFGGNVAATLTDTNDFALGWNWTFWTNVLKPLTLQLSPGSPAFDAVVGHDSLLPLVLSGATYPDVEFLVRESGTNLYLLATKREGATVNAMFNGLPDWATNATVLFENRTITTSNNALSDSFAQWDVHIYRFDYPGGSPSFTYLPASVTNLPTTTATFVTGAIAPDPISWQWRKNGTNLVDGGNISGALTPKLTVSNLTGSDIGSYDIIATSAGGSITSSPPAFLQVVTNLPPTITSQPHSQTNLAGTTAGFSVSVSGTPPFSYQWRKNGVILTDTNNVSGTGTGTLFVANTSTNDVGTYDVVISGVSTVTSSPATLTLLTYSNNLILYEPFSYSNIGQSVSSNTPANWTVNGSGANDLNVTSGSLSYPGLADPIGNSVTNGGSGLGVRRLLGTTVTNGLLYFSALFRINKVGYGIWNGNDSQVGALTGPDNVSFRLQILAYAWAPDGSYEIDFQKGGTGSYITYAGYAYEGQTLFLVGKYDFTIKPNQVTLWINPNPWYFGRDIEPPSNSVNTGGSDTVQAIDRFNMRQNTASSVPVNMQWDELRFGRTWASVTPPAAPVPIQSPTLWSEIYADTSSTNLLMEWPINIGPFNLESTSAVDANWQPVGGVLNSGGTAYIFLPLSAQSAFYRLHMQQ